MKLLRTLPILAICGAFAVTTATLADTAHHKKHGTDGEHASKAKGKLVKTTEVDAAWLEKARASYPLKACLTSDEALGSMGENAEFVYREAGKPDRLVVFCCKGCDEDFLADPAKYLAKVDAAAKGNTGGAKAGDKGHKGHH